MAITKANARKRRLRTWVRVANVAVIALCLWVVLDPWVPFIAMLVLACCPIAAALVAHRAGDEILLMQAKRSDKRPHLTFIVLLPCSALILRGLVDFNVMDWWQPLLAAIPVGLVFASPIGQVIDRQEEGLERSGINGGTAMFVVLAILGTGMAWSLIIEANGLGESVAPSLTRMTVVAKHESHGRSSSSYYLTLRSADFRQDDYRVSFGLYGRTEPGAMRCVFIHSGILRIRWYSVRLCPGDTEIQRRDNPPDRGLPLGAG